MHGEPEGADVGALRELGILESIGTTWTVVGVVILVGLGIMIPVSVIHLAIHRRRTNPWARRSANGKPFRFSAVDQPVSLVSARRSVVQRFKAGAFR